MKNKDLMSIMMVMLALLGLVFVSCSKDDDDELGFSESEIREQLESGSGTWRVWEKGDDDDDYSTMIFRDGKTNGVTDSYSSYWMTPYSVNGNLVYIKDADAEKYNGDVLEGGIRITKLTSTTIEFYREDDNSDKYVGQKQE